MFADDTNLFHSSKDVNISFLAANKVLQNINQWLIANELSLNLTKTKHSFFHKPSQKYNTPLVLPKLNTNESGLNQSSF